MLHGTMLVGVVYASCRYKGCSASVLTFYMMVMSEAHMVVRKIMHDRDRPVCMPGFDPSNDTPDYGGQRGPGPVGVVQGRP